MLRPFRRDSGDPLSLLVTRIRRVRTVFRTVFVESSPSRGIGRMSNLVVSRRFLFVGVALFGANAGFAYGQTVAALAGCYRFDRPYFTRTDFVTGAAPVVRDSTPILRLLTDLATPQNRGSSANAVALRPLRADSPMARQAWSSYWIPGDSGSIDVYWGSRVHPRFRLMARGDSLTGSVTFYPDTGGPPRRVERVSAVRIACPPS